MSPLSPLKNGVLQRQTLVSKFHTAQLTIAAEQVPIVDVEALNQSVAINHHLQELLKEQCEKIDLALANHSSLQVFFFVLFCFVLFCFVLFLIASFAS